MNDRYGDKMIAVAKNFMCVLFTTVLHSDSAKVEGEEATILCHSSAECDNQESAGVSC